MPNQTAFNPTYFLNRLALEDGVDVPTINPYKVIRRFFEFSNLEETLKLFHQCCEAALAEEYSWQQGSAGNLVYFHERVEQLIEACYLLYSNKNHKPIKPTKKAVRNITLPCLLSAGELSKPHKVIDQFFTQYPLDKWKRLLHCCMEAGISNYSIASNMQLHELLPYYRGIERLIFAAHQLHVYANKRKPSV